MLVTDVLLFRAFKEKKKLVCPIGWLPKEAEAWAPSLLGLTPEDQQWPISSSFFMFQALNWKGEGKEMCGSPCQTHPLFSQSAKGLAVPTRENLRIIILFLLPKLPLSGDAYWVLVTLTTTDINV